MTVPEQPEIVLFIRDLAVAHRLLDNLHMLSLGSDPQRIPPDTELTYEPIYDDFPDGEYPDLPS